MGVDRAAPARIVVLAWAALFVLARRLAGVRHPHRPGGVWARLGLLTLIRLVAAMWRWGPGRWAVVGAVPA